mmetsp:Transcript_69637/g.145488  ORF Transcript_69637/g.145488 Transcript_69637/m.145488 type:complete len:266 (-) Transcript_69637:80-877(-)
MEEHNSPHAKQVPSQRLASFFDVDCCSSGKDNGGHTEGCHLHHGHEASHHDIVNLLNELDGDGGGTIVLLGLDADAEDHRGNDHRQHVARGDIVDDVFGGHVLEHTEKGINELDVLHGCSIRCGFDGAGIQFLDDVRDEWNAEGIGFDDRDNSGRHVEAHQGEGHLSRAWELSHVHHRHDHRNDDHGQHQTLQDLHPQTSRKGEAINVPLVPQVVRREDRADAPANDDPVQHERSRCCESIDPSVAFGLLLCSDSHGSSMWELRL